MLLKKIFAFGIGVTAISSSGAFVSYLSKSNVQDNKKALISKNLEGLSGENGLKGYGGEGDGGLI